MGYSYRTTPQSAGRVNDAAPAPSADAAQEVAQSATIRCPRCRTEQEIIFNYATLGGGLGACVGPANRKQPCAECGSPPDEPCQRVYQNTIDLPASKNYSNTPPAAQPAEPVCKFCGDKDCWYGACRTPAPPAEPPATDADRLVHDLRAIAIDFAGDHQVDNTCRAAADLIERQARDIAEARQLFNKEYNEYRESRRRLREELSGERDRHKRTAERAERAEAELHKANIDSANLLAGCSNLLADCSDMSVDVEKYRREIAALREELSGERDRHKRTTERAERAEASLATVRAQQQEESKGAAEIARTLMAERDALRADAERYRWLLQYLAIARDEQSSWTCWLALSEIPFRFDPKQSDPTSLLDALMERHPIDAARAKVR